MSSDNEYMAQYMLARYHRRRQQAITQLGGQCAQCGNKEDLQLDHIESKDKTFVIAKALAGFSEQRIQTELLKIQLLCQPCHALKTILERGQTPAKGKHGTLSSAIYCRPICDACKRARREESRRYRASHKRPSRKSKQQARACNSIAE